MGGNALKNVDTRRVRKSEFEKISQEVLSFLSSLGCIASVIRSYREKSSFGDCDILYYHPSNIDVITEVVKNYKPKEIFSNGDVFSFEYLDFQIDLIKTNSDEFSTSWDYFAWNDLGNLVGRIAHRAGFKYGHKGLSYIIRDETYVVGEILVSNDTSEIYEFLGFDWDRFDDGFNTIEDIFDFVSAGKYFDPEIYLLHNRSHKARTRDAKRPTYNAFLKYCEGVDANIAMNKEVFKAHMLVNACKKFPLFINRHNILMNKYIDRTNFKNKFNGDVVKSITKLEGKRLGEFITQMIDNFGGKHEFQKLVNQHNEKFTEELITKFYTTWS